MSSDSKSNVHQIRLTVVSPTVCKVYEFEDFKLDAEHLMVTRNSQELPLTPKQVETLLALVEKRGEIVSKDALMTRLWGDSAVEESNLIQNIYLLRKIMGEMADGRPMIETLRRRGYRFNCILKNDKKFDRFVDTKFEYKIVEPFSRAGKIEPFVGRRCELQKLQDSLNKAIQGNGQL